jgi:cell division protein FtsW (lipid II flippase)
METKGLILCSANGESVSTKPKIHMESLQVLARGLTFMLLGFVASTTIIALIGYDKLSAQVQTIIILVGLLAAWAFFHWWYRRKYGQE